jgi:hypothetical protein
MRTSVLSCVSLFLLAACAGSAPYPAYALEDDAEQISNVVVSDSALQSVVRVGKAQVTRTNGGSLRIVVPIRNIDDEAIQILAQVSFTDAARQPIGDTTNRQVQIIPPGGTVDMEWTSLGSQAADYVLRLGWNN